DTGVSGTSTAVVTVNNVAPTAIAGGNQVGAAGVITTLHGTQTDPSPLDTFTYLWHLVAHSKGQVMPAAPIPGYAFIPSARGTYTFTFKVTDDDGGQGLDTAVVVVPNVVAPTVTNLVATTPINENGVTTISGNFTNPTSDTLTLVINWNDSTPQQTLTFGNSV